MLNLWRHDWKKVCYCDFSSTCQTLSSCQVVKLSSLILERCWTTFVFIPMLKSNICQIQSLSTCWTTFLCWKLKLSHCHNLSLSLSHSLIHSLSLNTFCFHVYAQKSLFIAENCNASLSHSLILTLSLSHSLTLSFSHSFSLDMLNNFYFHVYAQKWLFIAENCNAFFWTAASSPDPVTLEFIELVPS